MSFYSTETSEVLKHCYFCFRILGIFKFNRNIWSIETFYVFGQTVEVREIQPKHLKYWNGKNSSVTITFIAIQPKHLKYWNFNRYPVNSFVSMIQPKHLKYWNSVLLVAIYTPFIVNSTETSEVLKRRPKSKFHQVFQDSTETSEVLKLYFCSSLVFYRFIQPKHLKYWNPPPYSTITSPVLFNRNIWSIETSMFFWGCWVRFKNSTETSEVLKLTRIIIILI